MLGAILKSGPGNAPRARSDVHAAISRAASLWRPAARCRWLAHMALAMATAVAAFAACIQPVAAGDETVSMAFACHVSNGRVTLERGSDRVYRIVGKREQQIWRVCSGASAGSCRSLEIHRFTMNCDGNLVPWIDAAAASVQEQPWRASLVDGQMMLHQWPDGPARDRRLPLTLPDGFAPPPASGLRFAADQSVPTDRTRPPENVSPPEPDSRNADAASMAAAPFPTEIVEPGSGRALTTQGLASVSKLTIGQGWSAMVLPDDQPAGASWWSRFDPSHGSGALLAACAVALLLSATAVAARQHVLLRLVDTRGGRKDADTCPSSDTDVPSAASETPPPPPPPPLPRSMPQVEVVAPPDPVAALASALAAADCLEPQASSDWDAVIEMRTTAEALLDIVRQIIADHVPAGAFRDVLVADCAAISARLDGPELIGALAQGRLDLVHPIYAQAIVDLERARTLASIEHQRFLEAADGPQRTPTTVEEACVFLGTNPRASVSVVKKVVDALRQNWHPDLAVDELDRVAREERMKRINAAWDLVRADQSG